MISIKKSANYLKNDTDDYYPYNLALSLLGDRVRVPENQDKRVAM
jgi:hypothetical protein